MDLYNFEYKRMKPQEQLPLHRQDTWELTYIINGKGTRILGDSETEFTEGNMAFIPPHIPHCWKFDNEDVDAEGCISHYTLTFKTEFIDRCVSAFPELTERLENLKSISSALSFDDDTTAVIADMLQKMGREEKTELLPYVFRLILLLSKRERNATVIGRFAESDRTSERVKKVKEYSQSHYARPITIDMIAEYVGMNRSSFCTFFKKATGQTYITYLNKLRVDRACYLLRQGNFSVTEVCYMVGLNDVPYFNRCFKNNRGMSPKEYADGVTTQRQIVNDRQIVIDNRRKQ